MFGGFPVTAAGRPPEPEMEPSPERPCRVEISFGREHRRLKRADFTRIYQTGRKVHGRHLTVFGLRRPESEDKIAGPWRLGITATRKTGNAVERNRQRRRIREFFRLHQRSLPPGWDFVVNTRPSLNEATHRELQADLERALERLGLRWGTAARDRS